MKKTINISLLGARGVQDHHFHQGTGALQQTILVKKANIVQSDGKRCRKEQVAVADQCERAASGAGTNEKVEKAGLEWIKASRTNCPQ